MVVDDEILITNKCVDVKVHVTEHTYGCSRGSDGCTGSSDEYYIDVHREYPFKLIITGRHSFYFQLLPPKSKRRHEECDLNAVFQIEHDSKKYADVARLSSKTVSDYPHVHHPTLFFNAGNYNIRCEIVAAYYVPKSNPVPRRFQTDFNANLKQSYENHVFTDFTIKAGDRIFKTSKYILAANSEFYSVMFSNKDCIENQTGIQEIKDFDPKIVQAMIDCLHSGGEVFPYKNVIYRLSPRDANDNDVEFDDWEEWSMDQWNQRLADYQQARADWEDSDRFIEDPDQLEALYINFEPDAISEVMEQLYLLADKCNIKVIMDRCAIDLSDTIDAENFLRRTFFAFEYDVKILQEEVIRLGQQDYLFDDGLRPDAYLHQYKFRLFEKKSPALAKTIRHLVFSDVQSDYSILDWLDSFSDT